MSKIVLEDGKVIEVEIETALDEWFRGLQKAVMIDDCFGMQEIFVYEFIKVPHDNVSDIEFVDYYATTKELTKEQMIYHMVKRGLGRYDIVIPHKSFVLDDKDEDDF